MSETHVDKKIEKEIENIKNNFIRFKRIYMKLSHIIFTDNGFEVYDIDNNMRAVFLVRRAILPGTEKDYWKSKKN